MLQERRRLTKIRRLHRLLGALAGRYAVHLDSEAFMLRRFAPDTRWGTAAPVQGKADDRGETLDLSISRLELAERHDRDPTFSGLWRTMGRERRAKAQLTWPYSVANSSCDLSRVQSSAALPRFDLRAPECRGRSRQLG